MEPEVAAGEIERRDRTRSRKSSATFQSFTPDLESTLLPGIDDYPLEPGLFAQVSQLAPPAKLALICRLLPQLELHQVQALIDSGLQSMAQRQTAMATTVSPNTRLVLKKDYTYQDRGLTEPTQYYVYLRRCKPKLDRYIGTLFYVPQGCTLSYFLDTDGRIMFNPPHHIFQLRDYNDAAKVQVVRLIGLEPPPIDYTFTKQQKDIPAIYLQVEFLDAQTHQLITQEKLAFPACMHEGGRLDRYRWEVSPVFALSEPTLPPESVPPLALTASVSTLPPSPVNPFEPVDPAPLATVKPPVSLSQEPPKLARRVLELPKAKAPTFYLADRNQTDLILKRLKLWATWSEKTMPQAKWAVVPEGSDYVLINGQGQRRMLKFSPDQGAVILENTLPVLMKWFHDLGLVVSQTQSHRRYSVAQLKLARNLFVDMSLPQTDAAQVLKKLFGVEFASG
jgi:hypothetical protein